MMPVRRSARLSAVSKEKPSSSSSSPIRRKPGRTTQNNNYHHNGESRMRRPSAKRTTRSRKSALSRGIQNGNNAAASASVNPTQGKHFDETYGDHDLKSTIATTNTSRPHTPPLPPLDRPVEPHRTNATLLTPHGSSLVAYPLAQNTATTTTTTTTTTLPPPPPEQLSPTAKFDLPHPTATTGSLLEKATAHLIATDPRLKPVIDRHPCPLFSPAGLAEEIDPFRSLASSIIAQQVSGAAAKSIKDKFIALFNGNSKSSRCFPTPAEVARCDLTSLRTAGLSQRKAEYIQGLAQKFASGELSADMLLRASDEELLDKLIAVRGLGRWSVEMFACFALKRVDVFSTGDLGVQRGCAAFTGKDTTKLRTSTKGGSKFKYMSEKDMLDLAAKFSPYRSLFMWYMWRIEDVNVAVLDA